MSVETNLRELFGVDERPEASTRSPSPLPPRKSSGPGAKGEVKNPETINYRTFKPEKGGLFCERIFGPTRDWECACGKYKRIKHKGVVCDRCGVEVTLQPRAPRAHGPHRAGRAGFATSGSTSACRRRIGLMLDMSARQLERVIYYEDYIVTDPGNTPLERGQLLTEIELREAEDDLRRRLLPGRHGCRGHPGTAQPGRPRRADREARRGNWRPPAPSRTARSSPSASSSPRASRGSKSRPEWMIQTVLPVIPPDLRPLVPLEGGRFATSDLNDLYRRVINRNNRLKNLLQLKTPEVIIRNEKRMLQEAVDALFDNGRHGRAVTGAGNRPLKSLSDMLKGKGGRFRQNLLGKRVDYSGRSVIVIGPDLKLNQCGLPKKMALILFEPFIIRRLKELGYCHTVRSAKKMIDRKTTEVWDILEEVTKGHPVLLNRAPTLHRLSIQAFEPKLIEGEAIRVHPLVCTAYNADFDGDQMAVHVPLSVEAQMEARLLMLAPNNIFSPACGTPDHDAVAGHHSRILLPHLGAGPHPEGPRESRSTCRCSRTPRKSSSRSPRAATASIASQPTRQIRLRQPGLTARTRDLSATTERKIIETTPGRVRFNEIWPEGLGFINNDVGKKQIGDIIWRCYQVAGQAETVETLDELKSLGFREATRSGTSIGIVDMVIPEEKKPRSSPRPTPRSRRSPSSTATVSSPTASATRRSSTSGPTPPTRSPTRSSASSSTTMARPRRQPALHDGRLRCAG